MEEQQRELDERELADNQLHFKQVIWKSILLALIPAGIHVGHLLIAPEAFKVYWPYTLVVLIVGSIASCYVLVAKNRCPICNKGFGRYIPTQRSPNCPGCGSKIV